MTRLPAVVMTCVLLLGTGCQRTAGFESAPARPLVVVSAPLASQPWIGRSIERGARLAVAQLSSARAGQQPVPRLEILDNNASPSTAVANARTAIEHHAAALITDGTGALAISRLTGAAQLPVFVVFQGGGSFIDPRTRPNIFRLAPANRFMSRRLADYLASKSAARVAVLSDDSGYGRDGAQQLGSDLAHNGLLAVARLVLPVAATDVKAQVLTARRAGVQAMVVWAGAPDVAQVIRAARSLGWKVPIYASPTAEDPLVRQLLADHPSWLDGTTFVSFRITSEQGPGPFNRFRAAYERSYGAERVGLSAAGRPVLQPPDWAMYSYDALMLVSASLAVTAGLLGAPLLAAVQGVSITGANGDQRGFGPDNREGVSSSDMYFARFRNLRFAPVTDDLLSTNLPTVGQ